MEGIFIVWRMVGCYSFFEGVDWYICFLEVLGFNGMVCECL